MNTTLDIDVLRLAADHLDSFGHTSGWGIYGRGTTKATCAHGAVLSVCGQHPGDQYLWRPIISARGLTEQANDAHTKRWSTNRLRKYEAPSVGEMVAAFGAQWEPIRDLARRAAALTDAEAFAMYSAWYAARDAAGDAAGYAAGAGDAAWYAAWNAAGAGDAAWYAARYAAGDAVRGAGRTAWNAAWNAVRALAVRDLIGDTFTQTHYDTLTKPWASIIGPVHPDDKPVAA